MKHLRHSLMVTATTAALFACSAPLAVLGQTPVAQAPSNVQDSGDLLGATFESESAGISLRLPKGFRLLQSQNSGDDIGQFGDPQRKWELKINRILRDKPTALASSVDNFGK